uniref:Uncharacterized protein n=1 Tax=Pyrodinium bahamense TaxID=73915 RepID=A0A7S0FU72_9DINO
MEAYRSSKSSASAFHFNWDHHGDTWKTTTLYASTPLRASGADTLPPDLSLEAEKKSMPSTQSCPSLEYFKPLRPPAFQQAIFASDFELLAS